MSKLSPTPDMPKSLERLLLSNLSDHKAEDIRSDIRAMLRAYARTNMAPLLALLAEGAGKEGASDD